MTDLDFDVVDVFRGAECDPGVVRVISTVLDVNADMELLLNGLNEKSGVSQYRQTGIREH